MGHDGINFGVDSDDMVVMQEKKAGIDPAIVKRNNQRYVEKNREKINNNRKAKYARCVQYNRDMGKFLRHKKAQEAKGEAVTQERPNRRNPKYVWNPALQDHEYPNEIWTGS